MRAPNGRGPPPLSAGSDPQIKQPTRKLTTENKPKSRLSQDARGDRLREAHAGHFNSFSRYAAHHAILAAVQTESSPEEALNLFEARLEDQLRRFSESFADFWSFDAAFRKAAVRTMPGRRA
jgi:hypothetical protein